MELEPGIVSFQLYMDETFILFLLSEVHALQAACIRDDRVLLAQDLMFVDVAEGDIINLVINENIAWESKRVADQKLLFDTSQGTIEANMRRHHRWYRSIEFGIEILKYVGHVLNQNVINLLGCEPRVLIHRH